MAYSFDRMDRCVVSICQFVRVQVPTLRALFEIVPETCDECADLALYLTIGLRRVRCSE